MKKYLIVIAGVVFNCMLITGLLTHAFTLSSVKDSAINDTQKEYVYIEKTTVKEEKEIDPEERQQQYQQEDNQDDSKNYTNNTNNYTVKTTTKTTYSNDSKNNTVNDSQQVNNPQENTVQTKIICNICLEREAYPGDIYCNYCRDILNSRSMLGE